MENQIGKLRKALRHEIWKKFPGMSSLEICDAIRKDNKPFVKMSDLAPFCESLGIPLKQLPSILSLYSINGKCVTCKKFQRFLEDELILNATSHCEKETETVELPVEQWEILNTFVGIFKEKKASLGYTRCFSPVKEGQEKMRTTRVITESDGCNDYSLWVQAKSLNSFEYDNSNLRLAALCKFADESNLQFSTEEFVEAVFAFLGERTDHLTYEQFSRLMNSFA